MKISGVNLFYEYTNYGPGKVVKNLIRGLEQIGTSYSINKKVANYHNGLLQTIANVHDMNLHSSLCGPNLFVLPTEWGKYCKSYKHYIVPSQWVHDLYRRFTELDHATIDIWQSGIHTDFWKRNTIANIKCLIYIKNRPKSDLQNITTKLDNMKISYTTLEYGQYTEQDMITACNTCNFAILATGTESQGIGYMEILAMGLPCYVLNRTIWKNNNYGVPATSVPYFDDTCGIIADDLDFSRLDAFVQSINQYQPRDFICNNFNLSKKANDYCNLLKQYNCIS